MGFGQKYSKEMAGYEVDNKSMTETVVYNQESRSSVLNRVSEDDQGLYT